MRTKLTRQSAMPLATAALGALLLAPLGRAQQPIELDDSPRVRIETSLGDFVVELNRRRAPKSVAAFLMYVDEGFYEGTIFHRVVPGFIAQGGGYTADLEAKPTEGNVVNESGNGLSNLRGTVAFARSSAPHSATSQFYINLADNLDLNPRPTRWGYAVFGKVVEGMEVVDAIGDQPTSSGGPFQSNVPVEPIVIERIVVLTGDGGPSGGGGSGDEASENDAPD